MANEPNQVSRTHRSVGSIALLIVIVALIGNVAAFAYMRPFGILRELSVVAEARERIHARFVDEVDDQILIDAAVAGMANALGDVNTQYLSAKDLAAFNEHFVGEFSGIGAEIDIHENRLRIIAPLDGSPAWDAGVLPGDIVLEIDGNDTLGIEVFSAMKQLKGKAGTDVTIKVRHRDGTINTLTITRATIEVASVRGYRRIPGNGYEYMIDEPRKIAYVRLTQFGSKSYEDLKARLEKLKAEGMKALILDLRDNGGGLLDAAVDISDLFLTDGKTIVSTLGRAESGSKSISTTKTLLPDLPLVVLINQNSASASEILAGAMADNDRALIVGTRSFGKGSVQQLLPLGDGSSAIKLTTAYWYTPSNQLIHRTEKAERWGVDPSEGCFVMMTDDEVLAMLLKQRSSVADDPYEDLKDPITPGWLREQLLDDQLAGALDAAQTKIDKGDWKQVGVSSEVAMAKPTPREELVRRRLELTELIEQVDKQIEQLEQPAKKPEPKPEAEPAKEPTAEPALEPATAP